jgi:hypothetical protein
MTDEKASQLVFIKKFKSGLSYNSLIAIFYSIIVFIPAQIYITLMVGPIGALPAAWFTLFLWVELSRLSGKRITKQEAFMIHTISGATLYMPIWKIFDAWYKQSDIAQLFNIGPYIPFWAAPSKAVFELRTFLHPDWLFPILVIVVGDYIVEALAGMALGIFGREIFVENENLPFPIQSMIGETVMVMTAEKKRPLQILATSGVIGFLYGFILYALPFIMQAYTYVYQQIIPIPWVDLNIYMHRIMPGANFGIATDIGPFATGIILDFPITIGLVIGSLAIWVFGSWISVIYNFGPDTAPGILGYQSWFVPGMSIDLAWQRSVLYIWASILIGIGLAVGIAPILHHWRLIKEAMSSMLKPVSKRITDPISFKKVTLPLFIAGYAIYIGLFFVLVPNFMLSNLWFVPLQIILPFITTLVIGRMVAVTGTYSFPGESLTYLMYQASGYKGIDIWFVPNMMTYPEMSIQRLQWLKIAQITETSSSSLMKVYFITYPLALLAGYFFVQIFWSMAPIPSAKYPGIGIYWRMMASIRSVWISGERSGLFQPTWIAGSFATGIITYFILNFLHVPISFVSIGAGVGIITPVAITILFGSLVSLFIRRLRGKEWWNSNKQLIAAGLLIGESLAVVIAIAFSITLNSIWILPF